MSDTESICSDETRSDDGTDTEEEMDEEGNLKDFVVPDESEPDDTIDYPFPSDALVDRSFDDWKPRTKAEERFKAIIDKYTKPKGSCKKTGHQTGVSSSYP